MFQCLWLFCFCFVFFNFAVNVSDFEHIISPVFDLDCVLLNFIFVVDRFHMSVQIRTLQLSLQVFPVLTLQSFDCCCSGDLTAHSLCLISLRHPISFL